jgi:hypothetical protein
VVPSAFQSKEINMQESIDFHQLVQEIGRLLDRLPPGSRWTFKQEILGSLNRIVQLLANLEAERSELERMIAVLEAQAIIGDDDDEE